MEIKLDGAGGLCPRAQLSLEELVCQAKSSASLEELLTGLHISRAWVQHLCSSVPGGKGKAQPEAITLHRCHPWCWQPEG